MDARLLVAAALAAVASSGPARAQQSDNFRTLEFGVGGGVQATRPFAERWTPTVAVSLRGATPLHGGIAHLALRADANRGATPDLPDFYAVHGAVGWGPVIPLPAAIRLIPSVHVGAVAFRFDDDDEFTGALQNESEITLGAAARLDVPVGGPMHAWAGVDAVRVFTTPAELLVFGEVGVSVVIASPAWLQGALR